MLLNDRSPDGYTWSRERLTRKQRTSRPDTVWPEIWKHVSDASKRKEKQKWAIEKPKVDNAKRLRGIYFIDPDEEFKDIMKKRSKEVRNSDASGNAVQDSSKQQWWNLPRYWEKQDKICLYCRSWRVHENTIGRSSLLVSRRPYCSNHQVVTILHTNVFQCPKQTHEEATVYVKELDMFLTMKVLEDTPAVLSLGKLCDEHGYSYEWINGQKPHLIETCIRIQCNAENFVPIVVPGLSTSSSSSLLSSTSMTHSRQEIDHPTSSSTSSTSPTMTSSTVSRKERTGRPVDQANPKIQNQIKTKTSI